VSKKREQPASDPARKVRFGIKKVLSCEQEEAIPPAGASWNQEATMPVSAQARKVLLQGQDRCILGSRIDEKPDFLQTGHGFWCCVVRQKCHPQP
jgi:hypothetical protein